MTTSSMAAPYTSRIIKASALIGDTRQLLLTWDFKRTNEENFARARDENIFAKASRSRIGDVLAIFRQRYFADPVVGEALAVVAQSLNQAMTLDRLLYFYAARNDRLLHDVVTELLAPMRERGFVDVALEDIERLIEQWVVEGKTVGPWGKGTVNRVAQGVTATLRDFGVLTGRVRKEIAPFPMPVEAFAFIAFVLSQDERSGDRLLSHPEWRLFFLEPGGVERLFFEAHQRRFLEYHAAGNVIRIDFPCDDLGEYARALVG